MFKNKGFSLIELMVVIAIIGVIAGIGVPSFRQMTLDNRLVSTTNQILATVQQARGEAVSRRSPVTICGADDLSEETPECNADTDWSNGILMLQNRAGTATIIRRIPASAALEVTVTSGADEMVFAADGTTTAQNLIVTDYRAADDPDICRQIAINAVGQVRAVPGDERECE